GNFVHTYYKYSERITLFQSSNLSYAVFESDWTDLSQDIKKKLLFFTMQLKPVQISALNLFYLSLDTYMRVMVVSVVT
ncbi:hypothetical protein DD592_27925, partial [Enterobacter cloacae complex sp. 2DZ2F20B]